MVRWLHDEGKGLIFFLPFSNNDKSLRKRCSSNLPKLYSSVATSLQGWV